MPTEQHSATNTQPETTARRAARFTALRNIRDMVVVSRWNAAISLISRRRARSGRPESRHRDQVAMSAQPLGKIALAASIVVGLLLIGWFFFAWLVLHRHLVDAAGESIGSAFAILLVVSLVGAFRRNSRKR